MDDLRRRFAELDLRAPDLWSEIEARAAGIQAGEQDDAVSSRAPGWPQLAMYASVAVLAAVLATAVAVGTGLVRLPTILPPGPTQPIEPSIAESPTETAETFQLAYSLGGDIYLANWDGTNPVRIADGDAAVSAECSVPGYDGPQWSPDGRYLSYRSNWDDDCPGTVVISDADGRPSATVPGSGWEVAWSPDSTRFATWVDLDRTIGVYGVEGERQALLSVPSDLIFQCGDCDPVWSPDGTTLLVVLGVEVPLDGSAPRHVPAYDRLSFQWGRSADGTQLAYTVGSPLATDLWIANADGTDPRRLISGVLQEGIGLWSVIWSPVGDQVAFMMESGITCTEVHCLPNELRIVDVASGEVSVLAEFEGHQAQPIAFSPDGTRILFAMGLSSQSDPGLWSVATDGSAPPRLLVEGSQFGDWQPAQ